jgi:hypothetical protein
MAFTLTADQKVAVYIAALQATPSRNGEDTKAHRRRVEAVALQYVVALNASMYNEESDFMQAMGLRGVVTTLLGVELIERQSKDGSTLVKAKLNIEPRSGSDEDKDGVSTDFFRKKDAQGHDEWKGWRESSEGRLALKAKSLVGHRVAVWMWTVPNSDKNSFKKFLGKNLVQIEDRGMPGDATE